MIGRLCASVPTFYVVRFVFLSLFHLVSVRRCFESVLQQCTPIVCVGRSVAEWSFYRFWDNGQSGHESALSISSPWHCLLVYGGLGPTLTHNIQNNKKERESRGPVHREIGPAVRVPGEIAPAVPRGDPYVSDYGRFGVTPVDFL